MSLAIGQDSDFNGLVTDTVLFLDTGKGLEVVDATDGGPRGRPIFYNKQVLVAMNVEVLGVTHLGFLNSAKGLEETILRVTVVLWILGLRTLCFQTRGLQRKEE